MNHCYQKRFFEDFFDLTCRHLDFEHNVVVVVVVVDSFFVDQEFQTIVHQRLVDGCLVHMDYFVGLV